jgi:hypothetical protein
MKYIITEAQYSALRNLIKKHEDTISFLKTDISSAIETDVTNFLNSKFQGRFGKYGYMQYPSFFIYPDKLTSELTKYNRSEPALVIVYHINKSTGKVDINIFWNPNKVNFNYKTENGIWKRNTYPKNNVKWDYMNNPDGEEEFYSKLEKTINGRISEKAQNKIIDDFEKLYKEEYQTNILN